VPPIKLDQWREVSPHLDHALTLSPEEQTKWLAALRAERQDLADLVETLLAERRALTDEGFLESEPPRPPSGAAAPQQTLGPYRLVSRIGDGGMSSVWLAERADGRFEREVAVKFLHFAVGSKATAERFRREGRILGQLSHPHIAELLDAGVTPGGEPYLVLEYVSGKHIDEYCDKHELGIDGRLALFSGVLAAVMHAHANLVVHRDVKPSNVLVSDAGDVKLLDFGIAKLLAPESGPIGATLLTLDGGTAMTPLFAAPEQLTGGAITTATDIYSLGVLLYMLLAGAHPAGAGPHSPADLLKAITEVDPPAASQMALQSGSAAAERRGTTPEKLHRRLREDLDTILAKALKKKPAERYASVEAFGDDLQRFIRNEPISARPDSKVYRLRKYFRRHRAAVVVGALVLFLLAAFFVVQSIELRRISRERDRADRIANYMTGIFQVSDPAKQVGPAVTARDLLDKASHDIETSLSGDPQTQVRLLDVMGRSYLNLGVFSRAEMLFKEAIEASRSYRGENGRDVLHMKHDLAWAVFQQGRIPEALKIERDLADTQRRFLGPDDPDTLDTVEELAFTLCDEGKGSCEEGISLTRDLLKRKQQRQGPDTFNVLETIDNLAVMLAEGGHFDEGIAMQQDALQRHLRAFGPDDISTVNATLNLGEFQRDAGRDDEAMRTLQDLLERERRILAPDQGETAMTEYDIASVFLHEGQRDQALATLRQAMAANMAPRIGQSLPTDPHFASLHDDPRFRKIVSDYQKRSAPQLPNAK
jgi:eukaryotic-like serine/threonine-protein kinase